MLLNIFSVLKASFNIGDGDENRRRHTRNARCTLLTIQPLDDDLSKDGEATWGMSSDFSRSGVGFTCEEYINQQYVRITVMEDGFTSICKIKHSREVGNGYFYGAEFNTYQYG